MAMLSLGFAPSFLARAAAAAAATPAAAHRHLPARRGRRPQHDRAVRRGRVLPAAADRSRSPRPGAQDGAIDLDGFFGLHPRMARAEAALGQQLARHRPRAAARPTARGRTSTRRTTWRSATPGVKSTRDGWLNRYLQVAAVGPESAARRRRRRGRCRARCRARRRRWRSAASTSSTCAAAWTRSESFERRTRGRQSAAARHRAATRSRRCARCATHRHAVSPAAARSIRARRSARRCRRSRASPRPTSASRSRLPNRATGITTSTKAARRARSPSASTISPRGIAALAADLGDRMADTVILTMSEFGRSGGGKRQPRHRPWSRQRDDDHRRPGEGRQGLRHAGPG